MPGELEKVRTWFQDYKVGTQLFLLWPYSIRM